MATKRKTKPITFFGQELETDEFLTNTEAAGDRDTGLRVVVWESGCSGEWRAEVEWANWWDLASVSRKSKRAAVAAAERETLKLLNKLAAATGHRLVKKGRK